MWSVRWGRGYAGRHSVVLCSLTFGTIEAPRSNPSIPQTPQANFAAACPLPCRRPSFSPGVSTCSPDRARPLSRCHPPQPGAQEREAFGAVRASRSPFDPQAPQDNCFAACPRHNVMLTSPPANRGSPRVSECPPPVDLPGSPPLPPPPRRARGVCPFGSGLSQPASRQFRPLFYGGAVRAKFPPHPSSGAVRAPRRAQQHGRRAGGRLPPDDILQATSSHHISYTHTHTHTHTYISRYHDSF
jgi:hypothetical protein